MATLKAYVQKMRNDGFFPVYIRVTHNRTTQYIKTDKMVTKHELSRSKDITDPVVMKFCTALILDYNERLNRTDTRNWTAQMVVDYLQKGEEDLCFSDYARRHIDRLIDNGQERNAKNYYFYIIRGENIIAVFMRNESAGYFRTDKKSLRC